MSIAKTCRKCQRELPIDEFYEHASMGDGHLNMCKECVRTRVRAYRLAHIDEVRAYDTLRAQTPERRVAAAKVTARCRARMGYSKVHSKVQRAVMAGALDRPNACSECGATGPVVAHHPDYSQPLEVIWLCQACHVQLHVKERQEEVA